MSIFYSINGNLTLRPCPEVDALVAKLGEWGPNLEVDYNPETGDLAIFGGENMSYTGAGDLDDAIKALGKYATEASLFSFDTGEFDGGGAFAVGPTEEAEASCLSAYHYNDACDRVSQMHDHHVRDLLEFVHAAHQARVTQAAAGAAS